MPFVSVENIQNLKETDKFISKADFEKYYPIKPRKDDILMTRIGDIGTPAIVTTNNELAFYVSLALIRIISKEINVKYLFYYIQSPFFKRELYKRTIHNAFPTKINKNEIGKCIIIAKSLDRQKFISSFLSLLDKKISLLFLKIQTLKKYKEGILRTISKQGKTFVLRDIICEENVRTKTSNEYPILSSTSEGIFLQNDYFNHQVASNNNAGYKIVKKNQVVFSPQNLWLGNINLNDKFEIGAVSPSYKVYSLKRDLIDPYYFIEYMKSPYMLYQYKLCSKQGASVVRRNLDIDSFLRIKIKLPTLENQQTIKILQHHISNLKNLLQKLIKIKKYLLVNMFI